GTELGPILCGHEKVEMVSFTGSTKEGKLIGRTAGENLKKVSLELGGKAAHIVCADADLKLAAEKVALGATRNAGQACEGGHRLLVGRAVADAFLDGVKKDLEKLVLGDPLDPGTTMGPLVSAQQCERVNGYIRAGKEAGAVAWQMPRGASEGLPGYFVPPTVFTNVLPSMSIAQEEI